MRFLSYLNGTSNLLVQYVNVTSVMSSYTEP